MKPTVAILLSDKRSGSTMFQEELCRHPDVQHVSYTPHSNFETHHWLKAACILKMPKHLFYGNRRYEGYGSRFGAKRYMIDCIQGNVSDFKIPGKDEDLIFEGWESLCEKFARPVFFEKSPQQPHHWAALDLLLKWAEHTDYNVKFIGLVRNPMAAMYSAQERFFTDPWERQFGWAHCYHNIVAMQGIVGKERLPIIRYENLINEPGKIFKEIFEYLELEFFDKAGQTVHPDSVNKWHNDKTFTLQLHESVVRVAGHFGYTREDLYNPPKPGIPLIDRFRRHMAGTFTLAKARTFYRIVKPVISGILKRR